jgi:hypothetical protein
MRSIAKRNRRLSGRRSFFSKIYYLLRDCAAGPTIAAVLAERLVYAGGLVVLQAGDLILHMQLAAFEFYDRRVVDRRVRHGVSEFGLERLMLSFQFRKMRLDGHLGSLLCEIPDLNILTEVTGQVDGPVVVRRVKSP